MKAFLALLLASLPALAASTMECKTVIGVVMTCNGQGSPDNGSLSNFANMPNPAYIVRACMIAVGGAFPVGSAGTWSMAVDRDSIYVNNTGYPLSENNAYLERVIQIGKLEVQQGRDMEQCMSMNYPVRFRYDVDKIFYNFNCTGGAVTQPIVQICWVQ